MFNKSLILLLVVAMVATGCKDDELAPIVTQDILLFGAFPRLIELRSGEFDLDDLENSTYEMQVDFVDNAAGADVAQYNIYIAFDDNSVDSTSQDFTTERDLFRSYGPGDFTEGPNGNLGTDVTISFMEAANFVGVPVDSVISGDRFQVYTEVVKEDGRVFGSGNSTSAVTSAFGGIFDFNITATCPLPDEMFSGTYLIEYGTVYDEVTFAGAQVQALGTPPLNKTVELSTVEGSTTRRTFPIGLYLQPGYGFNAGTITLDFACDQVTATDIDAGASCGSGTIEAVQMEPDPFDLTDDSSFTITYTDFADDGGCGGVQPMEFTLVFTKQ